MMPPCRRRRFDAFIRFSHASPARYFRCHCCYIRMPLFRFSPAAIDFLSAMLPLLQDYALHARARRCHFHAEFACRYAALLMPLLIIFAAGYFTPAALITPMLMHIESFHCRFRLASYLSDAYAIYVISFDYAIVTPHAIACLLPLFSCSIFILRYFRHYAEPPPIAPHDASAPCRHDIFIERRCRARCCHDKMLMLPPRLLRLICRAMPVEALTPLHAAAASFRRHAAFSPVAVSSHYFLAAISSMPLIKEIHFRYFSSPFIITFATPLLYAAAAARHAAAERCYAAAIYFDTLPHTPLFAAFAACYVIARQPELRLRHIRYTCHAADTILRYAAA